MVAGPFQLDFPVSGELSKEQCDGFVLSLHPLFDTLLAMVREVAVEGRVGEARQESELEFAATMKSLHLVCLSAKKSKADFQEKQMMMLMALLTDKLPEEYENKLHALRVQLAPAFDVMVKIYLRAAQCNDSAQLNNAVAALARSARDLVYK